MEGGSCRLFAEDLKVGEGLGCHYSTCLRDGGYRALNGFCVRRGDGSLWD